LIFFNKKKRFTSVVGRVFGFVNKPLVGSGFSNILESEMCFVDSGFSREVKKKKKKKPLVLVIGENKIQNDLIQG
jgi:hypothetical protein